jgi:hypothetical protein
VQTRLLLVSVGVALVLTACGGGGPMAPNTPCGDMMNCPMEQTATPTLPAPA